MRRCHFFRGLAMVLAIQVLGMFGAEARAQQSTSLILVSEDTMPGNEARFSVILMNNPGAEVTQLRQWIEFPKDKLTYFSMRLSIAAEMAGAELKVESQDKAVTAESPDKNVGVLAISITAKNSLLDGPVAEILFTVAKQVEDQTLTLAHRVEAAGPDGKALSEVAAGNGSIKISKERPEVAAPLSSCFFYMH